MEAALLVDRCQKLNHLEECGFALRCRRQAAEEADIRGDCLQPEFAGECGVAACPRASRLAQHTDCVHQCQDHTLFRPCCGGFAPKSRIEGCFTPLDQFLRSITWAFVIARDRTELSCETCASERSLPVSSPSRCTSS